MDEKKQIELIKFVCELMMPDMPSPVISDEQARSILNEFNNENT